MKVNILTPRDSEFPQKLLRLHKPPKRLFIAGKLPDTTSVAIIGSRKCTSYGSEVAETLAQQLSKRGIHIISGLAYGIDCIAHRGSLEQGTTAVLPGTVTDIYPKGHVQLAHRILNSGALVSEHAPGTLIYKHSFIERNRLIAALSDAVIVVEAAEKSGSLTTAEFALELGIPVLAVPGPISSRHSVGTNRLIATGARPLLSYADVLDELGLETASIDQSPRGETQEEQSILDALAQGIHTIEGLENTCQMPSQQLSHALTHLELKGAVSHSASAGWHVRVA